MTLTDWAQRRPVRLEQVDADEGAVETDARAVGEPDGLLGNAPLNRSLRRYVPRVVARLQLAAFAALGAEH